MISPTVNLSASPPLLSSVWLHLSDRLFCLSTGLVCFPPLSFCPLFSFRWALSAPNCESTLLWQFCCGAPQTCMSCCIAMSWPTAPNHPDVLRVRAVLPQQHGNAKRMLHQCCGQDYQKNLLKLILHFIISAHSAPHMEDCAVLMVMSGAMCLEDLFFCWVKLFLLPWSPVVIIQVRSHRAAEVLCILMFPGDAW